MNPTSKEKRIELPVFVKSHHVAFKYIKERNHYFCYHGSWSCGYSFKEGEMVIHLPNAPTVHGEPLTPISYEEFRELSGGYANHIRKPKNEKITITR